MSIMSNKPIRMGKGLLFITNPCDNVRIFHFNYVSRFPQCSCPEGHHMIIVCNHRDADENICGAVFDVSTRQKFYKFICTHYNRVHRGPITKWISFSLYFFFNNNFRRLKQKNVIKWKIKVKVKKEKINKLLIISSVSA